MVKGVIAAAGLVVALSAAGCSSFDRSNAGAPSAGAEGKASGGSRGGAPTGTPLPLSGSHAGG